jgi:PIN domain nuclease of toxin-antitoxin system
LKLLIDTHIALWSIEDNPLLSDAAKQTISEASIVFVSAASIWEIAIKFALRKGRHQDIRLSGYDAIERFEEAGFEIMALEPLHVAAVAALPHIHRDPFDRILLAHAAVEQLVLMTHEQQLRAYGDFVMIV